MQGRPFEHFLPLFICTGSIKRGDCGDVEFFNRGVKDQILILPGSPMIGRRRL